MKVVYVGSVPPLHGGVSQHAARLVEALREAGHDVLVESWRTQYPAWLYPGGSQHTHEEPLPGARYAMSWWDPLSWWRAGRVARAADVVVAPWITPLQAPALRTVFRAARPTPAVLVVHNPEPHERFPFSEPLTRWILKATSGVVTHTEVAREMLEPMAPGTRFAVSPHPSNLLITRLDPPSRPPNRLLFFGFVRPYKGIGTLLEAVGRLRGRGVDVRLTIAGQVWGDVAEWRERIDLVGVEDVVDFEPGYVPDHDVSRLLAEHHAVVAPYRTATQSGVVPLAYAAGRPVIATRVGGLVEQVAEGTTGFLADPADPGDLARAIHELFEDYERIQPGVHEYVPTWAHIAASVLSVAGSGEHPRRFYDGPSLSR